MSKREQAALRERDRALTSTLAVTAAAAACAMLLLAVPRAAPLTLPTLSLAGADMRKAIAFDRELAARAPRSPTAKDMYDVLLAVGEQELGRQPAQPPVPSRIEAVTRRALAELGAEAVRALRARATERFMQALSGELADAEEARALCGAQRELLVRHGYLSPSGRLIAPALSVRATYKARWNMIFGLGPDFDLSPVERLAYEGFRGLEAQQMPAEQRTQALLQFAKAGGHRASEALAIWAALNGQGAALVERARAGESFPDLRVRNMALSVLPLGAEP